MDVIHVSVKTVRGEKCQMYIKPSATVLQLKERIMEKLKIPVKEQRLAIGGKMAMNDKTLESCSVEDGSVFHVLWLAEKVPPVQQIPSTATSTTSISTPDLSNITANTSTPCSLNIEALHNSPMVQTMLQNPQLHSILETAKRGGQISPSMVQQAGQQLSLLGYGAGDFVINPQQMIQTMQTPGFQTWFADMIGNPDLLENNPFVSHMLKTNPLFRARMDLLKNNPELFTNAFRVMNTSGEAYQAQTEPHQPSQQQTQPRPQLQSQSREEMCVLYATQLARLHEMGFANDGANVDSLRAANGRVEGAIERLVQKGK